MRGRPGEPWAGAPGGRPLAGRRGSVVIIDDEVEILDAFRSLLELEGYACDTYSSAAAYLERLAAGTGPPVKPCCVLLDVMMPQVGGLEAQQRLASLDDTPLLLMSGASGAQEAVAAFRAGAFDFLIKPVEAEVLLAVVEKAMEACRARLSRRQQLQELSRRLGTLTRRELEVAERVARGDLNRVIAEELKLALRTVKLYRQRALEKLEAHSTADLVRILQEGGG